MFTSERPLWPRFHAKSLPVPRAFGHYESRQYRHSLPLRRRHLIAKKKSFYYPRAKNIPISSRLRTHHARARALNSVNFLAGEKNSYLRKNLKPVIETRARKNTFHLHVLANPHARARAH